MGVFFFFILLGLIAIIVGAMWLVGIVIGIIALSVGLATASASEAPSPPMRLLSGPPIGKRVQIKKGAMKGRYGTVVASEGASVVLEDKAGRRATVAISDF